MKYIRTKDGRIYEIIDETENSFELCGSFEKKMGCNCIMIKRMFGNNEKPTYRLTDTIEELCDELVIDNPDVWEKKPFLVGIAWKEFLNEDSAKYQKENNIKLYGSIWVFDSEGVPTLKPVAKMNEKGELELL